jgi:hypothetical protein
MKIGKRCRETAKELLDQLATADALNFEVCDRINVHMDMENCER